MKQAVQRVALLPLEKRVLFCAVMPDEPAATHPHFDAPGTAAPDAFVGGELATLSEITYAANGLPELNSNPDAFAKLFLDFDGGIWQDTWYRPYAKDLDDTTFNAAEQASIIEHWQRVSEAYSPFNINVTTVDPGNLNERETGTIIVAGNAGGGGFGYVGGFFNSSDNKGITFTSPSTIAKTAAYISIHEAGHVLGLWHQSLYNASGQKLQEYYSGNSIIAPIMGSAYHPQRAIWWNGMSSLGPTIPQDDLAILSGGSGAYGYRPDDHGDVYSLATPIASGSVSGSGIIERMSDTDYFSFYADAGSIDLSASVMALSPTLDLRLELYEWNGSGYSSVASASTTSLSESLSFATDGGLFALAVRSQGAYGDVGQYILSGSVPALTFALDMPTNVSATALSASQVEVTWQDNSSSETGFRVQRWSDDGQTLDDLGVTAADAESFIDTTAVGGEVYHYVITAEGLDGDSLASQPARAVTLAGPSNLSVGTITPTKVTLSWTDTVSGELGFLIEKSTDGGVTWTAAAAASPNTTSVVVPSLAISTDHQFRIRAGFDGVGYGVAGNTVGATTLNGAPPAAPATLAITPQGPFDFTLGWQNVADETGYVIERSTDGVNFIHLRTIGANGSVYTDAHNMPGATLYYRVRAYNEVGSSGYSPVAFATAENVTIPAAPTALRLMNLQGATGWIMWNDNSDSEEGFRVEIEIWDDFNEEWSFWNDVPTSYPGYSLQGLSNNTQYRFRVYAWNRVGQSDPSNDLVVATGPVATTGLSATRTGSSSISVSWNNSAGEQNYLVQRSAGTPWDFQAIATVGQDVTSYVDNSANEYESYTYRVVAVNSLGSPSQPSNSSTVATQFAPQQAPTNVVAVPSGKGIAVRVTWDDVVGESVYWIERSLDGDDWESFSQSGANWPRFDDWDVQLGQTYYYRIIASNPVGQSPTSTVVSASPQEVVPPAAPQNLRLLGNSTNELTLAWDLDPNTVWNVFIERYNPSIDQWVEIYDHDDPDNPYATDNTGLSAGTVYSYRIRGYNQGGYGPYSDVFTTSTLTAAPTGMTVTNITNSSVSLSWNNVAGEDVYTIERSVNATNVWSTVGTTPFDVTTFTDTSVVQNTAYLYRVRGTNIGGDSAPSNSAYAFVSGTVPATPTGLTVTAVQSNRVDLQWNDVANETSYRVQRSTDGVNFSQIGTTAANVVTFADTTAAAATTYFYRVIAANGAGASPPSASVSALTTPPAPSGLIASVISATQVNLSWGNVAGETGYVIDRSLDNNTWSQVGTTTANVTTFQNTALDANTTYWYRVRAINGSGASANSNTASATTPVAAPAAPTNLVATALSTTQIQLTWNDVAGETTYVIQRSSNGTGGWSQVGTTGANVTTFTNSGLKKNTRYYYRVVAVNSAGNSPYSNIANTTTLR